MTAYYNEIDAYAAQRLRNLIAAGLIAPGDVDERSIEDVTPDDLRHYTQCHFFAGAGGWSYALRLAGWPDDRPVWTGSCPCQPFSQAGQRNGFADERHLWPAWFHIIEQCRPAVVLGEQVDGPDGLAWLDLVQTDLEALEYAVGPVVLPAAGVGAPHGRHRIYFLAHSESRRRFRWSNAQPCNEPSIEPERRRHLGLMADAENRHVERLRKSGTSRKGEDRGCCAVGILEHSEIQQPRISGLARERRATGGFWENADWIPCRCGKWRPIEPGTFPLAHGIPNRMDEIRLFGNAIVPQVAAEFIKAYLSIEE